jgi:hypothetical protein
VIGGIRTGCLLIQDDALDQTNKTVLPIIGKPTESSFFKQLVLIPFERICSDEVDDWKLNYVDIGS